MALLDEISEDHFKFFAKTLELAIEKYGNKDEVDLVAMQKTQVERLVKLEKLFRKTLIAHSAGGPVYKAFINHICNERRNILAARPYFRERQEIFTNEISKALKKGNEKSLFKFHFNYTFVLFAMKFRRWGKYSPIAKIAKEIGEARTELIEMNMPLAINRARIFWSRTPRSHLSYMDLVQIASEGLMSAIDKFCLPYTPVFRSVAIGRMVGNFIEQYSETMIHFYPNDKRKLYRANKNVHKFGDSIDYHKLAEVVNEGVEEAHKTNAAEIADLLAAMSLISGNTVVSPQGGVSGASSDNNSDGQGNELLDRYIDEEDATPEAIAAERDAMNVLKSAIDGLTIFEQKFLKLRGIEV